MSTFIKLTSAQAASVRGPSETKPMFALDPVERVGGIFLLPVVVLAEPAFDEHKEFLQSLPQIDSDDPAFPDPMPSPE